MECKDHRVVRIYPAKHRSELGKRSFSDVDVGQFHWNIKPETKEKSVIAEQLRRNRMRDLCSKLESLLPTTVPKLDRCGLYEEASNYILRLQEDLSQLKSQREALQAKQCGKEAKESMKKVKVGVEIHGNEVVIDISSMRKPRCLWRIMEELEEHHVDLNMSQFSTSKFFVYMHIHGRFREDANVHDPVHLRSSLQTRLQMNY